MPNDVTDYVASLAEPVHARIAELYDQARTIVPEATEGLSYGMPALLYQGKGLFSVMSTKKHIGVYPFGAIADLEPATRAAGLETTTGSIHLLEGQTLPRDLLESFLTRRVARIDARR